MPVRGKNDAFDTQEFWHGTEGFQVGGHAHPEHGEGVQTDCNADIVDDTAPKVARSQANVTFLVCSRGFHDDGSHSKQWLNPCVLEDTPFNCKKCMRVGDVDLGAKQI